MSRSSDLFPPVTRVHDGTRGRCPELRPIRCIFGCPWLPMETTNYTGKFRHL